MFTFTRIPNPNYNGQRNVVPTIQAVACECGSTDVAKRYTNDSSGEVDGVRYTCRACGKSETF